MASTTVFSGSSGDDAGPAATQHPLKNVWCLWFDNPAAASKEKKWEENLELVYEIKTVEELWGVINNIHQPTEVPMNSNFHLFKKGIMPMWEDPQNKAGGKWTYSAKRNPGLDQQWLHTMLLLLGEQFDAQDSDQICGCVWSARFKADRIAVWTGNSADTAAVRRIGTTLKAALALSPDTHLGYQGHADTLRRGSSYSKDKMMVV